MGWIDFSLSKVDPESHLNISLNSDEGVRPKFDARLNSTDY